MAIFTGNEFDSYLTLERLLLNPTGTNGIKNKRKNEKIISELNTRYKRIIKDVKFKFSIYTFKDQYLFHLIIPSETYSDIKYDACLLFTPNNVNDLKDRHILNYTVKIFCNSPDFMFKYTYMCNKYGILIHLLKNKLSKRALKDYPMVKNPFNQFGFEKNIYYAAKFIFNNELYIKEAINPHLKIWNKALLLSKIKTAIDKFDEYNIIKKKTNKLKKQLKKIYYDPRISKDMKKKFNDKNNKISMKVNNKISFKIK